MYIRIVYRFSRKLFGQDFFERNVVLLQKCIALEYVFELAYIARPFEFGKRLDFPFAERKPFVKSPHRDVVPDCRDDFCKVFPVAEWRDHDGEGVQSEEQVLAEVPVVDFVLQVPVRGAHEPEIDWFVLRCPQGEDGMFLQNAQQLALHVERHLSDFVQKESASVCRLHDALVVVGRSGVRTLLGAFQKAFGQVPRDGAAVERDEWPCAPWAVHVYEPGGDFLADSGFPLQKDWNVRFCGDEHQFFVFFHKRSCGDLCWGGSLLYKHAFFTRLSCKIFVND